MLFLLPLCSGHCLSVLCFDIWGIALSVDGLDGSGAMVGADYLLSVDFSTKVLGIICQLNGALDSAGLTIRVSNQWSPSLLQLTPLS